MADITWPTNGGRVFDPLAQDEAIEFNVELTTARSGRVNTLSLPGARWRCTLQFRDEAVNKLLERRQLEAFFAGLRGGADRLLMWNVLTPEPLGSMRGTVTLAATVAAGAGTAQVTGGYAKPNLLNGSSFELDSNADGVADSWAQYTAGAVTGASFALSTSPTPAHQSKAQAVQATSLGTSTADRLGVSQTTTEVVAGMPYSVAASMAWPGASTASYGFYIDWRDAGGVLVGSSSSFGAALTGAFVRYSFTATAPALAVRADVYVFVHSRAGGAGAADARIDAVQFEQSAQPTAYAGVPTLLRGDRIAFGGQRVMLTADATANDAGSVTVSFQPLHRAGASSGAAVTLVRPTTKYVLAQPVVQMPAQGKTLPGFAVELVEE